MIFSTNQLRKFLFNSPSFHPKNIIQQCSLVNTTVNCPSFVYKTRMREPLQGNLWSPIFFSRGCYRLFNLCCCFSNILSTKRSLLCLFLYLFNFSNHKHFNNNILLLGIADTARFVMPRLTFEKFAHFHKIYFFKVQLIFG